MRRRLGSGNPLSHACRWPELCWPDLPTKKEMLMKSCSYLLTLQIGVLATLMGFAQAGNAQSIVKFDAPGAIYTFPRAVNASGRMTGSYFDANSHAHGFVRSAAGAITSFEAPSVGDAQGLGTTPLAINDSGQIVGYVLSGAGPESTTRAFVREVNGTITVFDADPAGFATYPEAIN